MKDRKCSFLVAVLPVVALLLSPLVGCDQPRRYSRWSHSGQNSDYQQQLAADQRRRHEEEEQRHLDEERRQDRERIYDGRRY